MLISSAKKAAFWIVLISSVEFYVLLLYLDISYPHNVFARPSTALARSRTAAPTDFVIYLLLRDGFSFFKQGWSPRQSLVRPVLCSL